jgi:hypothetical protein
MTAIANPTERRTWPYFGLIGTILGIAATWAAIFLVPEGALEAGGQEFIDELDTGTNEAVFRISSGLGMIAAACLVVFAVSLRRSLDRRADDSPTPLIIEVAIVATAVVLFVGFIARAMVFDTGVDHYGQAALPAFYGLGIDIPLAAWGGIGLAAAAAAVGAFREGLFPRWFGWVSVVVVVLDILLAVTGAPFPMNFTGALWLLLASFVAMRR